MSDDDLSEEDKILFRDAMRAVKPLQLKIKKEPVVKCKPLAPTSNAPKRSLERIDSQSCHQQYYLSDHYHETVQADSMLSYTRHNIPTKRLKQLKNGKIPIEARLDLHGLYADAAQQSLCYFITQQQQLHHRCLLIIHGKGSRQGEAPVLKNRVNHWLKQLPQILAFHSALPQDGGVGALYVLLKC